MLVRQYNAPSNRWGTIHPFMKELRKKLLGEKVFRNIEAQRLFDVYRNDSNVWDYGVDNNGKIYFAYLNGVVERYTRRQFIQMAKSE